MMMRSMINGEGVGGGGNLMQKQRLESSLKELWDAWQIHCLILLSLFLQAFLFLAAGMRRRSASGVLRTLLWLAYLSADSVAVFVLGHLAVHATGPRHHLMSFWAPFVLVHLGGQDTITAFSKQDNELWKRHLLNLVTQVAIAGYVVAKAFAWTTDGRLTAAMVIMFLSGCFKYAERTRCLFLASPGRLKVGSIDTLSRAGIVLHMHAQQGISGDLFDGTRSREILDTMRGSRIWQRVEADGCVINIMSVDEPLNEVGVASSKDVLPSMLEEFLHGDSRYGAYEFVGARLENCYQRLYTKSPIRSFIHQVFAGLITMCHDASDCIVGITVEFPVVLYTIFLCVSVPIALVLFWAAQKGDHASRADIVVSYILLVGALVLDLSSTTLSIISNILDGTIKSAALRAANCIRPACSRKQWSEELAQYSIIKRHTVQGARSIVYIKKVINRVLSAWDMELFHVTHVPITKDMKGFILDDLLRWGTKNEWSISSSRGQLALRSWMDNNDQLREYPDHPSSWPAIHKSTSSRVDFPTSVVIWHIATDMCYWHDKASTSSISSDDDQMNKKRKEMSRHLSNYITYLVFKCGVMLGTHSQIVQNDTHDDIRTILSSEVTMNNNQGVSTMRVLLKTYGEEEAVTKLWQEATPQDPEFPVHPTSVLWTAREVAQELISIGDVSPRWSLISSVWLEMLYYIGPRCGGAFHYEHLTTGGELATHITLLMYFLGPFLPGPRGLS